MNRPMPLIDKTLLVSPFLCFTILVSAQTPSPSVTPSTLKTGEQVYLETCYVCHGPGLAKAPRFGDNVVWGKLIKEGQPVLTSHGWVGVRGMPAKGGRPDLTLEEFARATVWMARAGGASWTDPDEAMMARIRHEERKRMKALKKDDAAKN
jgi:cytochrome c5